jgi:hypothetical protein
MEVNAMDSEMKRALEDAGRILRLREWSVLTPEQHTTAWVLRWLNENGKYAQVRVYQESFISRHEEVTPESVADEVKRLIEADKVEIFN